MFAVLFISSLAAMLLVYICIPAVWSALMAGDDSLDAHESGLMLVASRNPFRETGPPANMAKLILLRHKVSLFLSALFVQECPEQSKLDPDEQQETTQPFAFTPGVTNIRRCSTTTKNVLDAFQQTIRRKAMPMTPRLLSYSRHPTLRGFLSLLLYPLCQDSRDCVQLCSTHAYHRLALDFMSMPGTHV
ncbi:hypothetical protein FA15DRAFT_582637 [Coprinopsis marcescibilis]|uniref:Uncharacterized protein n=1 Tax=Coprinopsis marcescibilis TaxID=230819 RepID=A0A5C3L8Z7_COPMA|nr:hypothetical protein FA15DRAFT_582637 [Coprinopsis marcescibilis]